MGDPDATDHTSYTEYHVRSGDTLASIAKQNGLTWQDLTNYNFGTETPSKVNEALEEYVGCTQRTPNGKNFVFTSDDDPGIIYIPKPDQSYDLDTGKDHPFSVPHPTFYSKIELQTVNDMGQRVGNVDLILRPDDDNEPDISLTSDDTGYGKVDKVPVGRYRVLLADGTPAYMFDPTGSAGDAANSSATLPESDEDDTDDTDGTDGTDPDAGAGDDDDDDTNDDEDDTDADDDDQLAEASIDTTNRAAITRIVVARVKTPEWRKQDKLLKEIHGRHAQGEQPTQGQGEESSPPSRDAVHVAVDNLALAAGWTDDGNVDENKLVKTELEGYLRIYEPEAAARGYYVLMLSETLRTIRLMNSEGNVENTFALQREFSTQALMGAYSFFKNVQGNLYVDLATMTYPVNVPQRPQGINIQEIVADPDLLMDAIRSHGRQVQILYNVPNGRQLVYLAILGGTGRLEDYGTDSDINDSIHERNLAVCASIVREFDSYIKGYQDRVKATGNEDQLRALGPPRTPFEFPAPAGATDDQAYQIIQALKTHELDAWETIAVQLDKFNGRLSPGYPFIRLKGKYTLKTDAIDKTRNYLRPNLPDVSGRIADEVEVETNIDFQATDGGFKMIVGNLNYSAKIKAKLGEKVTVGPDPDVGTGKSKSGYPIEVSYKINGNDPRRQTVAVKIGGQPGEGGTILPSFSIERDTFGKMKMSLSESGTIYADAEANLQTGLFTGGVTLKFGDLAEALEKKYPKSPPPLAKLIQKVKGLEIGAQVGFVGERPETLLRIITNAPGFFQRRTLGTIWSWDTHWVDLLLYEQAQLATLGWYQDIWDGKYYREYEDKLPASLNKVPSELTDDEACALVNLGFYGFEDYNARFKKTKAHFAEQQH